jgi:RNA polymerase sigma factor (sigma-70 family)
MSTSAQSDLRGATSGVKETPGQAAFAATHWSVVLAAGRSDTPRAQAALEDLCRTYWHPLYTYARRRGHSAEDAQDLTQDFFAHLLEHNRMGTVSPEKGRFRSFLLASMNHFLSDEWDKARAQKRGGGTVTFVDLEEAETKLGQQAAGSLSPEAAFERRWALTLLERVYEGLAEEYRRQGKLEWFEELRGTLAGAGGTARYAELAERLGMTEGAVKVAVHRLRHRYRELLRAMVAETVSTPEEVQDELRFLMQSLAG